MSIAVSTYPEPLLGQLIENNELVAVLAVVVSDDVRMPRFLIAYDATGSVSYVDATEVVLFPVPPGTDEDATGE